MQIILFFLLIIAVSVAVVKSQVVVGYILFFSSFLSLHWVYLCHKHVYFCVCSKFSWVQANMAAMSKFSPTASCDQSGALVGSDMYIYGGMLKVIPLFFFKGVVM